MVACIFFSIIHIQAYITPRALGLGFCRFVVGVHGYAFSGLGSGVRGQGDYFKFGAWGLDWVVAQELR